MAAVSEFAAREEQFQSYLNKTEINENECHTSSHIDDSNQVIHFNVESAPVESPITNHREVANRTDVVMGKIEQTNLLLSGDRRDSTNDEFVDINEMQFVHKDDGRPLNRNIVVKRLCRKTKRKDEECKCFKIWVIFCCC